MNGVLEMEGFKDTFRHLYNNTNRVTEYDYNLSTAMNPNTSMFDDVCSTGNGADSDVVIVRLCTV